MIHVSDEKARLVNSARLAAETQAAGLDALIVCSPVNIYYLSRAALDDQQERLWAYMPQFGVWLFGEEPFLVVSDSAEGQASRNSWFRDLRRYRWPEESPVQHLVAALVERGLGAARLGVELNALPARAFIELSAALPRAQLRDCEMVLERARAIKTPGEVELLSGLARKTEEAIWTSFREARAGDRERDLAHRMIGALLAQGADEVKTPRVGAGANAATRRRPPGDDPLKAGDMVRVDLGGWGQGFASDITRMAVVGPPSTRQREIYHGVRDIQQTLIECMRPGVRCGDLYGLHRRWIETHDLPFGGGILIHSIGARVHEYPVVKSEDNDATLEAGMVMAVEPSVTLAGEAKYTLEDLVLITSGGAVRLSNQTNTDDLFVIGT